MKKILIDSQSLFFSNYTEQGFIELRDKVLDALLKNNAFYESTRNGKSFLYKKSEKTFVKIIQTLPKIDLENYNLYLSIFPSKEEAFYCLRFRVTPFNFRCPICGNFCKFDVSSNNYIKTCGSDRCCQSKIHCSSAIQKMKATNLKKYGVDNVAKSNSIKDKIKKTNLERYGAEWALSAETVKEKRFKTNLEKYGNIIPVPYGSDEYKKNIQNKYGVDNVFQNEQIKEKIKETCLEKYGSTHAMQCKEICDKSIDTRKRNIEKIQKELNCTSFNELILKYGTGWYYKRKELGLEPISYGKNVFIRNSDVPKIEEYSKLNMFHGTSHDELDLQNFVKSICNEPVETNTRQVISPKELDIFIPSKKVAIEYDGIFWHSTCFNGNKKYHANKTKACSEKGIRLIHIFSDEWTEKQDICKSLISSALGIYKQRVYARDCSVSEISSEQYKNFLDENHIQGSITSSIRKGLFYKGELIQVAGWGKSRFKKGEIELHRMATKKYTQVIGGFSKLIKHSSIDHFYSYVDKRLFDGKGYTASGFNCIGESSPAYFYIDKLGKSRLNRLQFQKHKLSEKLDIFDSSLSEEENMLNNGYYRIYDCGQLKFEYTSRSNNCFNLKNF